MALAGLLVEVNNLSAYSETNRIARVYHEYQTSAVVQARWDRRNPGNQAILRERSGALRRSLDAAGFCPLAGRRVLEVGCGSGEVLSSLLDLGANAADLIGVDLLPDRIAEATRRYPQLTFLSVNGEALPLADESVDLVLFFTVFSSILDQHMARGVAAEAGRVLRRGGAVLWYDFRYDNPRNRNVRGMNKRAIQELFPDFTLNLRTATLLPPLARRLGDATRLLYPLLVMAPLLRTHYLGLLVRRGYGA